MILVTGGAGYIGSHCVLSLLKKGIDVVVFDNLSTGHIETIETLKKFGNLKFYQGDLLNTDEIKKVFENKIDAVIHFAALSQVAESMKNPQKYYINNVVGTINLLNTMIKNNVFCSVLYGNNVSILIFDSNIFTSGDPESVTVFGLAVNFVVKVVIFIDDDHIFAADDVDIADTGGKENRIRNFVKTIFSRPDNHIVFNPYRLIAPQGQRVNDPVASGVVDDDLVVSGIQCRLNIFGGIGLVKTETF